MRKLIILFLFLTSCSFHSYAKEDKPVVSLVERGDNAILLDQIASGSLKLDYTTQKYHRSLLHLAVQYDNTTLIQGLIDQGIMLDLVDSDGNTSLLYAINLGKDAMASALIDAQADPNIQNQQGDTALILAVKKNMQNTVMNLIQNTDNRLDPDLKDKRGNTALQYMDNRSLNYPILVNYIKQYHTNLK